MTDILRRFFSVAIAIAIFAASSVRAEENHSAARTALLPDEIILDGHRYTRVDLADHFGGLAVRSDLPPFLPSKPFGVLGDASKKEGLNPVFEKGNLKATYPWLYKLIYHDDGMPRYFAVNKWTGSVSISTGYPNHLQPFGEPMNQTLLDKEYALTEDPVPSNDLQKIKLVQDEVQRLIPKLSKATGLDIGYVPQEQETKSDYAKIRIVLFDNEKMGTFKFLRRDGLSYSVPYSIWNEVGPNPVGFRSIAEMLFDTAVVYTPGLVKRVDGYFLPNSKNEIQIAFCFIWSGHSPELIKGLVRECLVRSMGLPGVELAEYHSVLSHWVWPPEESRPQLPKVPEISAFDEYMLRLLYNPEIKTGWSYREVTDFLTSAN